MASSFYHYDNFTYGNNSWSASAYGEITVTAVSRPTPTTVTLSYSGYMMVPYPEAYAFQFEYRINDWVMYSEQVHSGGTHYPFSGTKTITVPASATTVSVTLDFTIESSYGGVWGWNRDPETPTLDIPASGQVYIDNGSSFDSYQCYIDNGTSFDLYLPYVDNGTTWELCV